jgi:hypothetical protein
MSASSQSITTETGQPEARPATHVAGMAEVQEYNRIQVKMKGYRERLKLLTPHVARVMETLPSHSFDVGDGKVKLTSINTFRPMTLPSLTESTLEMILTQEESTRRSRKENVDIANQTALFLWSRRTPTRVQRLQRTWSTKRGSTKRMKSNLARAIVMPSMTNVSPSSATPTPANPTNTHTGRL